VPCQSGTDLYDKIVNFLYIYLNIQVYRSFTRLSGACKNLSSVFLVGFLKQFFLFLGHAVAQLVETVWYMPEGRGFDSRWCHWNFLLT
jgi:hypothetical protein